MGRLEDASRTARSRPGPLPFHSPLGVASLGRPSLPPGWCRGCDYGCPSRFGQKRTTAPDGLGNPVLVRSWISPKAFSLFHSQSVLSPSPYTSRGAVVKSLRAQG